MTLPAALLLLLAVQAPVSLDQVKAESNPEHRAHAAVDYAGVVERKVEADYAGSGMNQVRMDLEELVEAMMLAQQSFVASGKKPGRSPGPYKYAEQHSRELLIRLNDLEQKMDVGERGTVDGAKMQVQEIHDAWFEGIMGRSK